MSLEPLVGPISRKASVDQITECCQTILCSRNKNSFNIISQTSAKTLVAVIQMNTATTTTHYLIKFTCTGVQKYKSASCTT